MPHSPREDLPNRIAKADASEHQFHAAEGERNRAKNLICSVDKTMILSMFYLVSPSFQVAFCFAIQCSDRIQTQIRLAKFKVVK